MASILPKCPNCGTYHVMQTYIDTESKERRFRCLNPMCRKRFKVPFQSAVYNVPMKRDEGEQQMEAYRNEQTERHDCHDFVEDFYEVTEQDEEQDYRDWLIDLGNMYYGGNG